MVFAWLGLMNPHRLTWGFAYSLPLAASVAIVTLTAFLFTKEKKGLTKSALVWFLIAFLLWTIITTQFALNPDAAQEYLMRVVKIILMTLITISLLYDKRRILILVMVIALSIGFYGIKGGIFTILSGGGHLVLGPAKSFIANNNEIGLVVCMVIPLLWCRHCLRSHATPTLHVR